MRDVLVTVHAYFTQLRRNMVIDATRVASMKPVTLVNESTVIVVSYTMKRQLPTREVHMIYDSRAVATRPNLIQTILEAKFATNLEYELIDRWYVKFSRGAERVKVIWSLDTEVNAGVEGLVGDNDFKTKLEQKAFDQSTDGDPGTLWMQLTMVLWVTIYILLRAWKLTSWQTDVERVISHSGNTRVPFAQTVGNHAVGSAKLANNVDADEVCVLGTAFYGASLCHQFRTKPIKVQDTAVCIVDLCYTAEHKGKDGNHRTIKTIPLPIRSTTGNRKTPTLKHKQHLSYDSRTSLVQIFPRYDIRPRESFRSLDTDLSSVSASEGTKVEGELRRPAEKLQSSEITPSLEPVIARPTSLEEKRAGHKRLISNATVFTKHEREESFNGLERFAHRFRCLPSDLGESLFNRFSTVGEWAKVK
ncbi:unnamed protein product [Rhizoctonia solani]|uniref:Uncharacterized protein n=1 Tax=Rhizoctonia solani TaxID=456999 RepID=A0A8H3AT60_9AGAM|nr:unnamed protein product [Rhizoctonia solani]